MKHGYLLVALLLAGLTGWTQNANDWIDYDQKYFKIPITEDGVYRIYYSPLNNAMSDISENLGSIDPRSLQVYGRGQELPIHVEGEGDGSFDPPDYIEFYA